MTIVILEILCPMGSRALAWFPSGKHLATVEGYNAARVWDTKTGEESPKPLMYHGQIMVAVDVSPGGNMLATASMSDKSPTACLWDTETSELIMEPLKGHVNQMHTLKTGLNAAFWESYFPPRQKRCIVT